MAFSFSSYSHLSRASTRPLDLDEQVSRSIDRPIFLIGMPRSGTSVLFDSFACHPDIGWLSYYFARSPQWPALSVLGRLAGRSPLFRKAHRPSGETYTLVEKLRDGPTEAYGVWNRYGAPDFSSDYLLGRNAKAAERRSLRDVVHTVLRCQGTSRFAAKLTGPARMQYLMSVFPDARFVHVVRDGRAVVTSLMRVGFWRNTDRMHEPAWSGGLKPEYLEIWESHDRSPLVLAALQWRNVVERTYEERDRCQPASFSEVRYGEFLADPLGTLERLYFEAGLPPSDRAERFLGSRLKLLGADDRFRSRLEPGEARLLDDLLAPTLERVGIPLHPDAPARSPRRGDAISRLRRPRPRGRKLARTPLAT